MSDDVDDRKLLVDGLRSLATWFRADGWEHNAAMLDNAAGALAALTALSSSGPVVVDGGEVVGRLVQCEKVDGSLTPLCVVEPIGGPEVD